MKIFNKIGIGKVRLVSEECNGCGKCNRVCDMQVDVLGDLKEHAQVNNLDCIRCLKCTDGCPTGAIAFRIWQKENISLNANAASRAEKSSLKRRKLSAFDIAIAVLWINVTLFFTFTVRQGAPQEIKVTMAAGLLLVIYGVVWLTKKTWQRSTQRVSERNNR